MLAKLIKFIQNNYPKALSDWLDSKYIHLSDAQLKKIADAYHQGSLIEKPASSCTVKQFIFHFGNTLILIKKSTDNQYAYKAELAFETDFRSIHSTRKKDKGFYFIHFAFDDHYQATLLATQKKINNAFVDKKSTQHIIHQAMPVLKAFMCAISE